MLRRPSTVGSVQGWTNCPANDGQTHPGTSVRLPSTLVTTEVNGTQLLSYVAYTQERRYYQ